jgi:hypothetical protein
MLGEMVLNLPNLDSLGPDFDLHVPSPDIAERAVSIQAD